MPLSTLQTRIVTQRPSAEPPLISIAFGAASVALNGTTTLVFTITNPNVAVGLTGVAFVDNLPAGLVVGPVPGVVDACTDGTVTAVAGASSISYFGGTLLAGASCTITVTVQGTVLGVKKNTTEPVTARESGDGSASNQADLEVVVAPVAGPAVIAQGSLKIIDISIPAAPVVASTVPVTSSTANDSYCGDASHLIYYFARGTPDANSRLEIFDASNRSAVVQLASVFAASSNDGYRCSVAGTVLWVVVDDVGSTSAPNTLRAFDVSNPAAPALLATYDLDAGFAISQNDANGAIAFGNFVYVVSGSSLADRRFGIYNATNPLAVTQSSVTDMVASGGQLALAMDFPFAYIYQGPATSLLSIFDVTNPAAPALVGSVGGFGNCIAMSPAPDAGFLYLIAFSPIDKGIRICDVSIPAAPVLVASPAPGGVVNRNRQPIAKNGQMVLIVNEAAGGNMKAQVYDASAAGAGILTLLGEVIYSVPTVGPSSPYVD